MSNKKYTIGIDFGTDSVRALVVDTANGKELATAVQYYPRWAKGKFCKSESSQFRQHPLDYLESLEAAVKNALAKVPPKIRQNVVGISVDTTGSTPVAVDKNGTPLALLPEFSENPNAMFILWKDHTANAEAEEINNLASQFEPNYIKYVGGIYSSEWFWAKILHTLRIDEQVRAATYSWVEHCDWIPAVLIGETNPLTLKRSRCAAGHKALWHEDFGGLPPEDFFIKLDPLLSGFRDRLFSKSYTADEPMGKISAEWAKKLGISENCMIGVGAFDCHIGAVGAAIEPYALCKVIGTSTCDMLVAPNDEMKDKLVQGICGQVDGSILPNMLGMEAGQSAFGDVYAWFQKLLVEPVREILGEKAAEKLSKNLIPNLSEKASKLSVSENDIIALDWFNGRRTPDANHTLKGSLSGLNLGSDAPKIFKALVEATAFGSKAIVERFLQEGVPIKEVIAIGGVAKKSPFVMQTLANVLNIPIKVVKSEQACALGGAIFAAVMAGVYASVGEAQEAMSSGFDAEYYPNEAVVETYQKLYAKYLKMGEFVEQRL